MAFEKEIGFMLPEDYRDFLKTVNGGRADVAENLGIYACYKIAWSKTQKYYLENDKGILGFLYPLKNSDLPEKYRSIGASDLYDAYEIFREKGNERIPVDTIAIGDDPGSNQILLGVSGQNRGKVFYWFMDVEKNTDDPSPPGYENVALLANSFNVFVEGIFECGSE